MGRVVKWFELGQNEPERKPVESKVLIRSYLAR